MDRGKAGKSEHGAKSPESVETDLKSRLYALNDELSDSNRSIDEHLVNRVLSGDRSASVDLDVRYRSMIERIVHSWINDPQVAEEIAQETLIKAFKGLKSYRFDSHFKAWILTIAKNVTIDWKRKESKNRALIENAKNKALQAITNAKVDSSREVFEIARSCLSTTQYRMIWLKYVEAYSIDDIAIEVGKTINAVRSELFRARKELRKHLEMIDLEMNDWEKNNEVNA